MKNLEGACTISLSKANFAGISSLTYPQIIFSGIEITKCEVRHEQFYKF